MSTSAEEPKEDPIYLAHKIALDPNQKQVEFFRKSAGVARFAYNWMLGQARYQHEFGVRWSRFGFEKQLVALKKDTRFNWMNEVGRSSVKGSAESLDCAFKKFFKEKKGFPRFKKRGEHDSFLSATAGSEFSVEGKRVRLPRIGWVKMREELRLNGDLRSATVVREAHRWFVVILVKVNELPRKAKDAQSGEVGVDLGVTHLATISDGRKFEGAKAYDKHMKRLGNLQKKLARQKKGSSNRQKTKDKIARLHYKISCIRKDALHKLTTTLTTERKKVAIEDLNVKGMLKNKKLSRSISDQAFGEFRRQLEYKGKLYGCEIEVADRFFPSSKLCSSCGEKNAELELSHRKWTCKNCGATHDRDVNAAINLSRANHARSACQVNPIRDQQQEPVLAG